MRTNKKKKVTRILNNMDGVKIILTKNNNDNNKRESTRQTFL